MKTNEATYIITTEDNSKYCVTFVETHNEKDYGNGIYIGIKRQGEWQSSMDMRYQKGYNFTTACENYIKEYYGANLLKYEKL